jgi:hypothetical protein
MKKMSLIIKCLLPVLIIFIHTVSVFAEEQEIRVTIRGKLLNIAAVGEYISSQTTLKLYPCDITGKVKVQKDKKETMFDGPDKPEPLQEQKPSFYLDGFKRLVPQSNYPRIGLPNFEWFKFFRIQGIEPGSCCKIYVMMLDKPYPGMVALTTADGQPFEFVIPESGKGENSHIINVDITKTPLIIPELKKR